MTDIFPFVYEMYVHAVSMIQECVRYLLTCSVLFERTEGSSCSDDHYDDEEVRAISE